MNDLATVENVDPLTGEVTTTDTPNMAGMLAKAEIDQQIATAHKFPRSLTRVATNVTSLATFSPAAAAECNYALPRGGKSLTGPSIRLAEIIFSQYGNARVGARVVHVDRFEKYLEAEGVFHDLETNAATTARVRRRISDRNGRLLQDDMIIVTGNAACSIAKRNAILAGVPKALWMPAYDAALNVIKGDAKTLTERREGAFRALGAFGVTPDMIFGALGIGGVEEIALDHMPTMIAWHKALKDEEQTVESLFPAPAGGKAGAGDGPKAKGSAAKMSGLVDDPKKKGKKAEKKGGKKDADDKAPAATDGAEGDADDGGADEGGDAAPEADQGDAEADKEGGGDETPEQSANRARQRGGEANRKGMPLRAIPDEFRDGGDLEKAWTDGWREADKAG